MQSLTNHQAAQLLKKYGPNEITEQKKKHFIFKFFEQFNNFLTILLIFAAVLSFFIGEPIDGVLILAIVILNAFFGLYQEAKAEASIAALKKMTVTKVRVIRAGVEIEIDSRYLVPGDIIHVEEGVKVPADGRVIEAVNLEINESALTGESLPVAKTAKDELYSGTIVTKGRGTIEVIHTGMMTKFGQIAANISSIVDLKTPLQKKLENLTRMIGVIGIGAAAVVFVLSFIDGSGYFPAFLLSISLAVAVVPEGLPAVMTITLAIGVGVMAKKKSIIRKLSAIEGLGGVTLIATDKTGTLTTNKMKVKEIFVDDKVYKDDRIPSVANRAFSHIVLNGILCSTASLVYVHDHGRWDVLGDPTEGSLLFLAQKAGLLPEMVRNDWKLVHEAPFDSVTKKMTVVVNRGDETIVYSKGAPESILEISDKILRGKKAEGLTPAEKRKIETQVRSWAGKGLRVLAFAYKNTGRRTSEVKEERSDGKTSEVNVKGLTFIGMVAIHDAPRPEVNDAVIKAKQAGIKIVMITGDNERTAEAIGVTTGIINEGDDILTGKQLDTYSDKELLEILPKVKVFARTTPFQKHRIVRLYQELGEVVAVTGDGVNDAIALKQADVGMAMGLVGTDVARETADMVITDDNFASIVNAVEEGRNIIKNLKNAISYLLSCNVSEAFSLIAGLALGFPNIFYPIQFLYINLITDGFPALALAFSPRNPQVMKMAPDKELNLLNKTETKYIFSIGALCSILVLGSYFIFSKYMADGLGKTAAFSVLTLTQSFIFIDLWLSHQSMHKSIQHLISPLFIAAFSFPFIIHYFVVGIPSIAAVFRISPISLTTYFQLILISGLISVGIKGIKKLIKLSS